MLFRADEWALRNVLIGNTPREPPLAGTEAEHPSRRRVQDVMWLADAGANDWVVFMKDAKIRRRPWEQRSSFRRSPRPLSYEGQSLSCRYMAARFITNLEAIAAACEEGAIHLRRAC
jgi:PIN like domain